MPQAGPHGEFLRCILQAAAGSHVYMMSARWCERVPATRQWTLEHCGGTGPAAGGGHPCPGMRLCPELGFPGMRGASGIGTDTLSSSHPGPFRVLGGGRVKVLGAMGPARASPLLWAQRPARGGDTFPGPPHTWRRRPPGFLPGLILEPRSRSTAQVGPKLEKPGLK